MGVQKPLIPDLQSYKMGGIELLKGLGLTVLNHKTKNLAIEQIGV